MAIEILKGRTLVAVDGATEGSERVTFTTSGGDQFAMYHSQECCETVLLEEVIGDVKDLIGSPIVEAEEVSNRDEKPSGDVERWTFYKLRTTKGNVTLRWLGRSNGYYSVSVEFERMPASQ